MWIDVQNDRSDNKHVLQQNNLDVWVEAAPIGLYGGIIRRCTRHVAPWTSDTDDLEVSAVPIAVRSAETNWTGPLASGTGALTGSSGALDGQPVTWAARTEDPGGKTSPEELAAAAHSSCFSMALALVLGENKTPPGSLKVSATVTLDEVDGKPTIVSSAIKVSGTVDGLDAAEFKTFVDQAAALCPISRLFAGTEVTVEIEA